MTGYARLSPWQARVVLGLIVLVAGAGVAVTLSPLSSSNLGPHPNEAGDVALYRAEVARIRHGERYYQAAAAELTARGYPTRSVFNWRTPLPVWLLGKLPAVVLGKALLGGLALALLLMAFEAVSSNNSRGLTAPGRIAPGRTVGITPIGCALLLTGPLLPTVLGDLFMMPVLWAGVLIGLSACAFGINRPQLGVALGLAAVFFRELALPYCILCAVIALWQGRRREVTTWMLGLAAWLAFFGWHWWQVHELMAAGAERIGRVGSSLAPRASSSPSPR